eukprot:TRINITY_DN489_c0_g2_i1.p3 TRINITY_DN489_c0_g2~~TRINITY_DN489_c0_g2_i1.p3  ORF type:complete len:151 (-),score=4.80 TRINITY_DN489_c0_g2_i1:484-936(-)
MKTKLEWSWQCKLCQKECVPVRSESRCLCGHRLKNHRPDDKNPNIFSCKEKGCRCPNFFFVVAQGAWILKCSCKHKHVDHDPETYACMRHTCQCESFRSPWVCNCDHPWDQHVQVLKEVQVQSMQQLLQQDMHKLSNEINNWDEIRRGQV